jgi:pimeloyl-ACP methyl ester carboxylesterase
MAALVIWLALRWLRLELTPARMPHPPLDAQASAQGLRAVSVPTVRGRQLHAWWWPQAQVGKGACAVLMHGWGGNASNLMSAAQHLHALGWHVLLPDARSHGLSDGDDYSSLPRFAEDIDAALAWLATQVTTDNGTPASRLLMGHSLGAAACILSASRRRDVNAVVSISAFAHPEQVMRRWLANYHLPFWPLGWGVNRYIEHVIGHRFNDIAPLSRLPHVRCPVLLVHGQSDNIVPMHCVQLLMDSQPLAELLTVAGTHEVFEDQMQLEHDVLKWLMQAANLMPSQSQI